MRFVVAALLALTPSLAATQTAPPPAPPPPTGADSIAIAAGVRYKAGSLHRWFGDTYRDLWKTPVRVQVLNLRTFAGGLHPLKTGGGNLTRSLRLINPDGIEYVFRLVLPCLHSRYGGHAPGRLDRGPQAFAGGRAAARKSCHQVPRTSTPH